MVDVQLDRGQHPHIGGHQRPAQVPSASQVVTPPVLNNAEYGVGRVQKAIRAEGPSRAAPHALIPKLLQSSLAEHRRDKLITGGLVQDGPRVGQVQPLAAKRNLLLPGPQGPVAPVGLGVMFATGGEVHRVLAVGVEARAVAVVPQPALQLAAVEVGHLGEGQVGPVPYPFCTASAPRLGGVGHALTHRPLQAVGPQQVEVGGLEGIHAQKVPHQDVPPGN
ncbi:hypothetical protein Mlute_02339 [Meiothermus luteus]|uniref:Uncharacterized protein n=1 Tax=Meiothermus luteus TaxID=2026184 RepID=A0A399EIQ9_9DEIN|nr:hypothetical protein Mlute_02339 [Meiothermus luteus]